MGETVMQVGIGDLLDIEMEGFFELVGIKEKFQFTLLDCLEKGHDNFEFIGSVRKNREDYNRLHAVKGTYLESVREIGFEVENLMFNGMVEYDGGYYVVKGTVKESFRGITQNEGKFEMDNGGWAVNG